MSWQGFILGALVWATGLTFIRWRLYRRARRRLEKSTALYYHASMVRDVRTEEEREYHLGRCGEIFEELQKNG